MGQHPLSSAQIGGLHKGPAQGNFFEQQPSQAEEHFQPPQRREHVGFKSNVLVGNTGSMDGGAALCDSGEGGARPQTQMESGRAGPFSTPS